MTPSDTGPDPAVTGAVPAPPPVPEPPTTEVVHRVEIEARIIWQTIGAVLTTLVMLWAFNEARGVLSMVAISFFFSLALEPPVRALTERFEWRRGAAVGVVYVVGLSFVVFLIWILIPSVASLATTIGENGAEWLGDVSEYAEDYLGFELSSGGNAANVAEGADAALGGWADEAFGTVLGIASSGVSLLFNLATIAMFTFYFTAEAPKVKRAVLRMFEPNTQQRIGWTWDTAIEQTGGYFYSRMILFFINGFGFFFTMVAVGVPTTISVSLALFGGFVSVFIPAIGTYIGAAIPILITWALQGFTPALIVLGYALVYQQIENYWLSPKISSETMTLNGGVAFGAALAGGAIAGPMGAFTALPVAALISSFISNYVVSHEVVYQSAEATAGSSGSRRKKNQKEKKPSDDSDQ